ncbi:hypothetical protein Tco_0494561 [Tanacetum coccineum]
MFDELLTPPPSVDLPAPEVIAPIDEVVAPVPAVSTGSPSSQTIKQCKSEINEFEALSMRARYPNLIKSYVRYYFEVGLYKVKAQMNWEIILKNKAD